MKEVEYRDSNETVHIVLVRTAWSPFSDDTMTSRNGAVQLWDRPALGHVLWFWFGSSEQAVYSIEDI